MSQVAKGNKRSKFCTCSLSNFLSIVWPTSIPSERGWGSKVIYSLFPVYVKIWYRLCYRTLFLPVSRGWFRNKNIYKSPSWLCFIAVSIYGKCYSTLSHSLPIVHNGLGDLLHSFILRFLFSFSCPGDYSFFFRLRINYRVINKPRTTHFWARSFVPVFFFPYMCIGFASMSVCQMHAVPSEVRRGCYIPWRLEIFVSHHVGSGNLTQVLWKSSRVLNGIISLVPLLRLFKDKILCSTSSWARTHSIAQTDLALKPSLCLCLLPAGLTGVGHHT